MGQLHQHHLSHHSVVSTFIAFVGLVFFMGDSTQQRTSSFDAKLCRAKSYRLQPHVLSLKISLISYKVKFVLA